MLEFLIPAVIFGDTDMQNNTHVIFLADRKFLRRMDDRRFVADFPLREVADQVALAYPGSQVLEHSLEDGTFIGASVGATAYGDSL